MTEQQSFDNPLDAEAAQKFLAAYSEELEGCKIWGLAWKQHYA